MRQRLCALEQHPVFDIVRGQIQPNFRLRDSLCLPTLVGGVWYDKLRDAVNNCRVSRPHAAVMDDQSGSWQDVIEIYPIQQSG